MDTVKSPATSLRELTLACIGRPRVIPRDSFGRLRTGSSTPRRAARPPANHCVSSDAAAHRGTPFRMTVQEGIFHQPLRSLTAFLAFLTLASSSIADTGEFLITDHGAKGDNAFDNAPIINGLIAKFGASGGTIVIPEGDFRINSPVVVDRNFVTIRGVSYGQRSNVDPPPGGVFGPAGGSKLILGAGVRHGIAVHDTGPKTLGLTIKDLAVQGSDSGVYQVGVFINHANQWTRIDNLSCVNLKKGVFIKQAEEAQFTNSWIAECEAPLHMDTGRDCIVADSSFGGQPGGVTCDFHAHTGLVFHGNVIFPDGYTGLWLTDSHGCAIVGNTITGTFTGLVQIEGNMNRLSENNITAVTVGGAWLADPRGRDGLYGLVRILGNDNVFASSVIMSWQPEGDCRVHCGAGDRNTFRNLTIGANASARRIFLNGTLTSATRITHCGHPQEIDLSGSATARVRYDP
jgi:parallel beta-helix repeat protein